MGISHERREASRGKIKRKLCVTQRMDRNSPQGFAPKRSRGADTPSGHDSRILLRPGCLQGLAGLADGGSPTNPPRPLKSSSRKREGRKDERHGPLRLLAGAYCVGGYVPSPPEWQALLTKTGKATIGWCVPGYMGRFQIPGIFSWQNGQRSFLTRFFRTIKWVLSISIVPHLGQ